MSDGGAALGVLMASRGRGRIAAARRGGTRAVDPARRSREADRADLFATLFMHPK